MSVGQIKSTGIWYCQYRKAGKQSPVKEYFGAGAAGKKQAVLRDLEIKTLKQKGEEIRTGDMYLDELAQLYLNHEKRKGRNKTYLTQIRDKLNKEWLPLLSDVPVGKLTFRHFEKVHMLYDAKAVGTQNRYMDYLNIIFNFGVRFEYIDKNPMAKWWREVKKPEKPRDLTIDLEDFKRLYSHAAPHLQWALEVMWELGVRPGRTELFGLMWKDVNWANDAIRVRGTKTRLSDRVIPISTQFKQRLEEKHKQARTKYLIEYRGRHLLSVRRSFQTAKEAAKIEGKLCMYSIRHLYTSVLLANGADAKAVAGILGHTSLRMIMHTYYHELNGERRKAIESKPTLAV